MRTIVTINSIEKTKQLAEYFASKMPYPSLITLSGDLGAGKTTFVGFFLKHLGYDGPVISPTFNILKCYFETTPHIYHIDAYRLEDQNIDIGLEDYIEGDGICFVEWPLFIEPILPIKRIDIVIKIVDEKSRIFEINDSTNSYSEIMEGLSSL